MTELELENQLPLHPLSWLRWPAFTPSSCISFSEINYITSHIDGHEFFKKKSYILELEVGH